MPFWKNVNQTLVVLVATHNTESVMLKLKADIKKYRMPLKQPIAINQNTLHEREGFILSLKAGDRIGYGEIAPLPGFSCETLGQAEQELLKFCKAVNNGLTLQDIDNPYFLSRFSKSSVSFGIESAIWWLKREQWLTPQTSTPLLQGDIQHILQRLQDWQGGVPHEFKVKTGRHLLDEDVSRIEKVLDVLPESVNIKLDANRQWSYSQARDFLKRLAETVDAQRISFVEEPTPSSEEFIKLYQETGIPFALDETVQQSDFKFKYGSGLAAIVVKPTLVGSLRRCYEMIESAQKLGVRAMISSSYESVIGLHTLHQISAKWTPMELPGLDTASVFRKSLTDDDLPKFF